MIEPGVRCIGHVDMGEGVSIAAPAELMARWSKITIGDGCDIAAFVVVTTASSHRRCIGQSDEIDRREIVIEEHVFLGTGATILGGTHIGHHSVIGAGVVLSGQRIPPWSRVRAQAPTIEGGFYNRA